MCGIAGLFALPDVVSPAQAASAVRAMNQTLVHRGPDADGIWLDPAGRCVLGHRRLSIIDTSDAGLQPMASRNKRWLITFNGEIYNFQELRSELAAHGISVSGRTDTEVLVECIALWGLETLPKLDGMFALGAFNTESGELLLARDPFGEKPLYYMELPGGGIAFASELQALQQVPGFDDEVSLDAMAEVLMFQYIGAPRTIYRSIKKLPPGHWLSTRRGQPIRLGRYFEFEPGASGFDRRPMSAMADELEAILSRSIKRRLISDVPLGAFLSGGVDSSTVCALVRKKLGLDLKTFSLGFEGAVESEHEAARAFARHLGTEHHDQILTPHTSEFLLGIGKLLDEPNADSSCMPTYLLSGFARQQVTVALSGDGGDEMFAGYGRYFVTLDEELTGAVAPGQAYYADRILVSTEKYIQELFGSVPEALALHVKRLREQVNQPSAPLFCRLRKTDVDNYMPGAVLSKVDRMSMQHSLEVRTPFLNVELARFAERLPLSALYSNGRGKLLLREVAYRYLPKKLVDAPKKGFGIPMSRWGKEPLLNVASRLLENDDSRLRSALGSAAIERFMKRQRGLGGFSTYQVWSIAMLESWLRHHPARLPSTKTDVTWGRGGAHRKPLYAWPLGNKRYAVLEDPLTNLEEMDDTTSPRLSVILQNTMRLSFASTKVLESPPKIELENSTPIVLDRLRPAVQNGIHESFQGAAFLFPEREASRKLDFAEIRHLERLGVNELFFVHPFEDNGPLIRLTLRHKEAVQRLRDVWYLYRHRIDRKVVFGGRFGIGIKTVRCRPEALSYQTGPLAKVASIPNTEFSDRYMLFEGTYQMPPLPAAHEDIRRQGGGRYSVWSQHCFFSPTGRPSPFSLRHYWLVEKSKQTEAYLDFVPEFVSVGLSNRAEWITAVERYVASTIRTAETPPLVKGDKIVVLTHSLPPGGAERQWCYLARGLHQAGYDVSFMVTEKLEGPSAHYLPLLEKRKINVCDIGARGFREVAGSIPQDPAALSILYSSGSPFPLELPLLTSALKTIRPKAIFAQLDSINLMAGVAAHLADVPCTVLSFRNYNPTNFPYLNNDWFLPLYRALSASNRIVLSGNSNAGNADYAQWIGVPQHDVAFIPNALDPDTVQRPADEALATLRSELGVHRNDSVMLGVFRLSDEKRPLDFIEVCVRVAARLPRVKAILIGVGPLKETVAAAIAARGAGQFIKVLGRRDDVSAIMHISSLLLLTSSHEGMPNVVMEAQLIGLPVVATDAGGTRDLIIDRESGHLCNVGDLDCLTERCCTVLQNAENQTLVTSLARQRLLDEYSVHALAARHLDLVQRGIGVGPDNLIETAVPVSMHP